MTAEQRLRRSVMSCLLWESGFYEDGQSIADRIAKAAGEVPLDVLARAAIEARSQFNLRHAPLLLLALLAKRGTGSHVVSDTIAEVIQRADEPGEFLSIYWKMNPPPAGKRKAPLSAQVKKGLARALAKFDAYQLAKYDRDAAVKLRDVLFMVHAKPRDDENAALYRGVADRSLESPDTWEVALSAGADKKETFERLIRDGKLGYLALLRNLRNMAQAGCDPALVRDAIVARKGGAHRVLPFRYVAAARAAPQFEPALDQALSEAISELPPLPGTTVVMVDVSGSMGDKLSAKSDLTRRDAAAALASIIHGDLRVFSFSDKIIEVPPRRGMAGVDAIAKSQPHSGTYLGAALKVVNEQVPHDRLIVITDEQSHDRVQDPVAKRAYMINVASARNGVGYGRWLHLDGFSERVLGFINEHERAGTR
jgi:hypothetical protein